MPQLTARRERIAQQMDNIASAIRSYRSIGDRASVRRMERVYRQISKAA